MTGCIIHLEGVIRHRNVVCWRVWTRYIVGLFYVPLVASWLSQGFKWQHSLVRSDPKHKETLGYTIEPGRKTPQVDRRSMQ